jgi:hypothetical protein
MYVARSKCFLGSLRVDRLSSSVLRPAIHPRLALPLRVTKYTMGEVCQAVLLVWYKALTME